MANVNFINTTIPTGDQARLMELQRRQQMADLLMAQGMKEDKGQMVGDIFVAPSWTQGLARMANAWAGTRVADQNQKDIQRIANDREQQRQQTFAQISNIAQGLPAGMVPQSASNAALSAQGVPSWAMPEQQPAPIPAADRRQQMVDVLMRSGDPALQGAGTNALITQLFKDPKWEVTDRFNDKTGRKERVLIDMNNPANVVPFGGQEARNLSFQNLGSEVVGFDPTTGARVTSANTSMSPGDAANLRWKIWAHDNPSAAEQANIAQGNARIANDAANTQYNTGMSVGGGATLPQRQPMPDFFGGQQPMVPMTQTAPTVPQGAPMVRPTAPVAPRMPGQPAASPGRPQAVLDPQAAAAAGVGVQPTASVFSQATPKRQQELLAEIPQAAATAKNVLQNVDRLLGYSQELRTHPGMPSIVGKIDQYPVLDMFPQTRDARALQSTIVKQAAVSALQAMRDASKTGGAVGNVTEKEWPILEQNLAALDAAQTPAAYATALQNLEDQLRGVKERALGVFEQTYGRPLDYKPVPHRRQSSGAPRRGTSGDDKWTDVQ